MWVTEFGMVKFAKELQLAKAPSPMWVTEFGMVSFANVHTRKKHPQECAFHRWEFRPLAAVRSRRCRQDW